MVSRRVKSLGKLLIILFSSPKRLQNTDTIYEFAEAAVEEGHEVTLFFDLDAVYDLMTSQMSRDQGTPTKKVRELITKGVRFLACSESTRLRGLDSEEKLIKGTIKSSLGELALLMDQSDRVTAFSI